MFVVVSLQTVNFPFAVNDFRLRELVKDFVVPSLVVDEAHARSSDTPRGQGESGSIDRSVEYLHPRE